MELIADIFKWIVLAGAGIGLIPIIIGYAKEDAGIVRVGFTIALIPGLIGFLGILTLLAIKYL